MGIEIEKKASTLTTIPFPGGTHHFIRKNLGHSINNDKSQAKVWQTKISLLQLQTYFKNLLLDSMRIILDSANFYHIPRHGAL